MADDPTPKPGPKPGAKSPAGRPGPAGAFTRKVGPLPVWAWGGLLVGVIALIVLMRRGGSDAPTQLTPQEENLFDPGGGLGGGGGGAGPGDTGNPTTDPFTDPTPPPASPEPVPEPSLVAFESFTPGPAHPVPLPRSQGVTQAVVNLHARVTGGGPKPPRTTSPRTPGTFPSPKPVVPPLVPTFAGPPALPNLVRRVHNNTIRRSGIKVYDA